MNGSYTPLTAPKFWNWMDQNSWGGNCNRKVMQSPIKIDVNTASSGSGFGDSVSPINFTFNLQNKIPFDITKNGEEVVVKFDNKYNAGFIRNTFTSNNKENFKDFRPSGILFRFPAEHMLNGNRYDGEIIFEFVEATSKMDPVYINIKLNI